MKAILLIAVGLISLTCYSQESDPLAETQALLKNKEEREKIIKNDKKAQSADAFATTAVGGNQNDKEELYGISAEALEHIIKTNGDDPTKLNALMLKALQNPEEFKKSLPKSLQERIETTATKVEGRLPGSSHANKIKP